MRQGRLVNAGEDCDLCGREPPEVILQRMFIGDYSPYILCAPCRMLTHHTMVSFSLGEKHSVRVVVSFP